MRTVHLLRKYNPAEWGGTETAIHRLFDGLRKHNVTSIVFCPALDRKCSVKDPLEAAGCQIKRFKAFVPTLGISDQERREQISVGGNLMSFDLIPALWKLKDVSLVHTHALGRIGAIGSTLARRRGIPLVVSIHGGVLDLPENLKSTFHHPETKGWEWGKIFGMVFRSRQLMDDADAIVTCNPREAELHQKKYPTKRIMVQPHGVPMEMYQKDQRHAFHSAFPHLTGRRILLSVGRIDFIKNQGWLVQQAPALFAKHPDAALVLAGACTEEKYGKMIEKKIQELGLEQHVFLTGGLPPGDPRLIGLLQQAGLLILPSLSETFGLVLLEAWAAGTAVISSRTSGGSSLIKHGENGFLFDLEKPETFHRAVDDTLLNPAHSKEMAAAGANLVASGYNTDVLAGRMKNLYQQLIEKKHALRNNPR